MAESFNIDGNKPVIRKFSGTGRAEGRAKYPWANLAIGESFFVPAGSTPLLVKQSQLCALGLRYSDHHPKHPALRFTTRCLIKDGIEGVRVWRVQ